MDSNTPRTSKVRREQLKSGTDEMKQYFPLNEQDRKDLSQLQALHYACIYLRKISLFASLSPIIQDPSCEPFYSSMFPAQQNLVEGLCGYLIVLSRDGNLLYVSENVLDYLGLKSIDVLLSCDKIYEVLHPHDEVELKRVLENKENADGLLCSWNASKIRRKQHSRSDLKVIKMTGHFVPNTDIFVALCVPLLNITNRECLCAINPLCFTSVLKLDMKFTEICKKGENLLGYRNSQITNVSLYDLLNVNDLEQIRTRHKNLLSTKSQKGKIDTVKILMKNGVYVDCLINIYYSSNNMIVCRYQILSDAEMEFYKSYMLARSQTDDNQNQSDGDIFDILDDYENSSSFSDSNNVNPNNDEKFHVEPNFGNLSGFQDFKQIEFKIETGNTRNNKRYSDAYEIYDICEPKRQILNNMSHRPNERGYQMLAENMVTINPELINQEIMIRYREVIDNAQMNFPIDLSEKADSSFKENIFTAFNNSNFNENKINTVQQLYYNCNSYTCPSSNQYSEPSYLSTPNSPEEFSSQNKIFDADLNALPDIDNFDISFDDLAIFQSSDNVEAALFDFNNFINT